MFTSEITYLGNLRTQSKHIASSSTILTDAPIDNHGKGEAFSPTDLMSNALGCCMLTIIGIAANTHQFNIDGTRVQVTKIMQSNPRKVAEIKVNFKFPANDYSEKQKTIIENAARTCPVALSLHPELIQTLEFNY
jgi:putative redox protein